MTQIQYIHIAFEFWAVIFCIIAAICVFAARIFVPRAAWSLIVLLLADAVLNIAEIVFYANKSKTGEMTVMVLKSCMFIIIEIRFALKALVALHLESIVCERGGLQEGYLTKITYFFSAIGFIYFLVLLMSGRFMDPYAISHTDIRYIVQMILLLAAGLPTIARVLRNRRTLRKRETTHLRFIL